MSDGCLRLLHFATDVTWSEVGSLRGYLRFRVPLGRAHACSRLWTASLTMLAGVPLT